MKRCSCLLEFTLKVNKSARSSIIKDLAYRYIRDAMFERFQAPWNVNSSPCCRDSNGRKRKAQSFKSVLQACCSNCTRASDICENTRFREDVGLKIYHQGEVGQYRYILQGSFQRLKFKCKCWRTSDCYTCLFSRLCLSANLWQAPSLFCYSQLSHFISAYTFQWKWCSGFRGCFSGVVQRLSLSSPAPCTNTHLPCLFIPSPHTAEHQSSFLNQGFHTVQSLSKVHKTLDLTCLKRAKKMAQNFSIMPKLREVL